MKSLVAGFDTAAITPAKDNRALVLSGSNSAFIQ